MSLKWLPERLQPGVPETQGYARLSVRSDNSSEKPTDAPRTLWLSHIVWLLPSFLHPSNGVSSGRRTSPTAWLDGLRGVAAFVVVWHHSSLVYFSWSIHDAWKDAENGLFVQLPLIRLVIAGIPAVCIFFVISGYAISLRLLRLSHLGRASDFADALSSSLFRRHPRLFMPATFVMLVTAVMSYFGAFPTEAWSEDVAIATRPPPRADSLWDQMLNWGHQSWHLAYPVRDTVHSRDVNPYDPNLWTLPVEFGCSLLVFTVLAVMFKFRPFVRMAFLLVLIGYSLVNAEENVFLFLCGVFLADLRTYPSLRGDTQPPELPLDTSALRQSRRSSLGRNLGHLAAFVAALFLLSMPEMRKGAEEAPGFATLASLVPQRYLDAGKADYFWVPLAAVLLVATLDSAPFLQRAFTSHAAQYLGDISFSMYLVHGPLLWSYGAWLAPRLIPTGEDVSAAQYGWGVALCYLCFWPVVIYEADLVTRIVDERSVKFARWVYNKLAKP